MGFLSKIMVILHNGIEAKIEKTVQEKPYARDQMGIYRMWRGD